MRYVEQGRPPNPNRVLEMMVNAGSLLLMVNPSVIVSLLMGQRGSNKSAQKVADTLRGNNRQKAALGAIAPGISDASAPGAVQRSLDSADIYATGVTNVVDYFLQELESYSR